MSRPYLAPDYTTPGFRWRFAGRLVLIVTLLGALANFDVPSWLLFVAVVITFFI